MPRRQREPVLFRIPLRGGGSLLCSASVRGHAVQYDAWWRSDECSPPARGRKGLTRGELIDIASSADPGASWELSALFKLPVLDSPIGRTILLRSAVGLPLDRSDLASWATAVDGAGAVRPARDTRALFR